MSKHNVDITQAVNNYKLNSVQKIIQNIEGDTNFTKLFDYFDILTWHHVWGTYYFSKYLSSFPTLKFFSYKYLPKVPTHFTPIKKKVSMIEIGFFSLFYQLIYLFQQSYLFFLSTAFWRKETCWKTLTSETIKATISC